MGSSAAFRGPASLRASVYNHCVKYLAGVACLCVPVACGYKSLAGMPLNRVYAYISALSRPSGFARLSPSVVLFPGNALCIGGEDTLKSGWLAFETVALRSELRERAGS